MQPEPLLSRADEASSQHGVLDAMTRMLLRLYLQGRNPLGPGKIQLLTAIRDEGSISAAARSMRMSYRSAWLLVDSMNGLFRQPVVTTTHGGRNGGGATVTTFGRKLIDRYQAMERSARQAIARDLTWVERSVAPPPSRRSSGAAAGIK